MIISFDKDFNKIITIPSIEAEENASNFKYLHTKTLYDLDKQEEISDVFVMRKKNIGVGLGIAKALLIVFKEATRPNVIFRFSQPLMDRINNGESEDFLLSCQFFYWVDDNRVSHIRFARPIELTLNP